MGEQERCPTCGHNYLNDEPASSAYPPCPDPFHDTPPSTPQSERWRVGRKVGRTIYRQLGPKPSDDDPLIGVMDSPELAQRAVTDPSRLQSFEAALRSIRAFLLDPDLPETDSLERVREELADLDPDPAQSPRPTE